MTTAQDIAAPVSMVFLYYDNPKMLQVQIDCWNKYAGVLTVLPEVLLIDDGSPKTSAAAIVREIKCALPLKVFRIKEDIAWNFAGARNLGCVHAAGWIYVSDIDTLLPAEDARKFFETRPLDPQSYYMPKRVWLPDLREASPASVNLLFHKEKYLDIGGYDEDYAGHYGREETDYYRRIGRAATKVFREDVVVRAVPPMVVPDARTITHRPRDKTRNAEVFARKEAAGFVKPVNPLRFSWERVL